MKSVEDDLPWGFCYLLLSVLSRGVFAWVVRSIISVHVEVLEAERSSRGELNFCDYCNINVLVMKEFMELRFFVLDASCIP